MAMTADMPLQPELQLVNYMRSIAGVGSNGQVAVPGQAAPGTPAVAGQAPELTQDTLSNIMTEWLRGSGNFLNAMHQQNQSGLYNSSTRRLVANDLTAQAALKAAQAGSAVQMRNAELSTQASMENARNSSNLNTQNARFATDVSLANAGRGVAGRSSKDSAVNTLLAAALNAYRGKEEKDAKGKSKSQNGAKSQEAQEQAASESFNAPIQFNAADSMFAPMTPYEYSSANATTPQMSFDPAMQTSALSTYDMAGTQYFPAGADYGLNPDVGGMSYAPVDYTPIDYSSFSQPIDFSQPQMSYDPSYTAPDYTPIDYSAYNPVDYSYNEFAADQSYDYTPIDYSGW